MNLKPLFYPKSVAVVGASHEKGSVGNDLVKNLTKQGYRGKIYAVNPKGGRLYGLKVYKSLTEISGEVDLIVVAVPAKIVPLVLKEAVQKQVKAAAVISAGFKEIGQKDLEDEIVDICRQGKIALVGPNCLGVINPEIKLNAAFVPLMPAQGKIAFVSQSGALCSSVLDYAGGMGIGFSKFISIGNKAMIKELELLDYLYRDSETKVIMMYVEDLDQATKLIKLATMITRGKPAKPIIMLKSGRSEAGSKAAQSHTGAMGGSDAAYSALSTQAGMIRVDTIEEMFDLAEAFSQNHLLRDNQVAVLTNAGGPGVLTTDELIKDGLELAKLSSSTKRKLQSFLPPAANTNNPVDILGDADAKRYRRALELVVADSQVDGVLVILTPQSMTQIEATARAIVKIKRHSSKPIVVSFMGDRLVEEGQDILSEAGVTSMSFPEPAAQALGALYEFGQWLEPKDQSGFRFSDASSKKVEGIFEKTFSAARKESAAARKESSEHMITLDVAESFQVLKAYGFSVVRSLVVNSVTEARAAAKRFKNKVVLKILSDQVVHKSDVGGVMLDVDPDEVATAYRKIVLTVRRKVRAAKIDGVQISEMVPPVGLEIILGVSTDPRLGKLLMVGLGGIYTEVFSDVSWGLAPITHYDARRMVASLQASKIFKGWRGQPALDVKALEKSLGRLSQLVTVFPEIKELDMNPVRLLPKGKGIKVLDARIVLVNKK